MTVLAALPVSTGVWGCSTIPVQGWQCTEKASGDEQCAGQNVKAQNAPGNVQGAAQLVTATAPDAPQSFIKSPRASDPTSATLYRSASLRLHLSEVKLLPKYLY